jgi:hypothetical protein
MEGALHHIRGAECEFAACISGRGAIWNAVIDDVDIWADPSRDHCRGREACAADNASEAAGPE